MTDRILCVDDDEQVRTLIRRVLSEAGHECIPAADVAEARRLLEEQSFAAVLCDINMPGSSGLELLRELRSAHPDVATVMVTARDDLQLADRALDLGAYGYVTKPFSPNDLLIDLSNALRRRQTDVERRRETDRAVHEAYAETLRRLSRAVEFHDGATGAHIERVGEHAAAIARTLGFDAGRVELLRQAAPLHDIGKIFVPVPVLTKPGPLDVEERRLMEQHAERGHELLSGSASDLLQLAAKIAWTHHERWDGNGYPRGLTGPEIPLEGRIAAVADVFDAITSDRPYRAARSVDEAVEIISADRGTSFDPDVVDAFLA